MGLFDTVLFVGNSAVLCHAGHEVRDFQTKDMEETMSTYVVEGGFLYRLESAESVSYALAEDGSHLIATTTKKAMPIIPKTKTKTLLLYASCFECDPVICDSQLSNGWSDFLTENYPWIECELQLTGNQVTGQEVSTESREEVRLRVPGALPDDDRVVKRRLESLKLKAKKES